jgi:hypothetical protein
LFIAGEALGYLMMSTALLFAAPVFAGGRIERAIRWLFVAGFVLAVAALVGFWLVGGDLVAFEVAVLSITGSCSSRPASCLAWCSGAPVGRGHPTNGAAGSS